MKYLKDATSKGFQMGKLQLTRTKFLTTQKEKDALVFARERHKNQSVIGNTSSYINHCIEVARLIHKYDYSEDAIIAGLIHNTVNSSDTSVEDIENTFGESVSNIVEPLVEDSDPTLTWTAKKLKYIQSITNAPEESVVVSVADNLQLSTEIIRIWLRTGDSVFLSLDTNKENYKWFFRSLSEMYFIRGLFFENQNILTLSRKFTQVISNMGM